MDGPLPARVVRLRADLRAAGFADDEIGRARARGELVPVRRGAYLDADDPALQAVPARHRAADRALAPRGRDRSPLLTPDELAAAVGCAAGRTGAGVARRVAADADGRSGSVGETRSRIALARAGIPEPVLQWEVLAEGRRHVTDFAWPELGVVAEFDGRVKYGRALAPGQDPAEAVWQEKLREDRLRGVGLVVVRWIWRDIDDFAATAARLLAALTR